MSSTIQVRLSRTTIASSICQGAGVLRDSSRSKLYFKYDSEGVKGGFYLVKRPGKGKQAVWHLLGRYPEMSVSLAQSAYDVKLERLATDKPVFKGDHALLKTVNQVLDWYQERRRKELSISKATIANTVSTVNKRLKPYFEDVSINHVSHDLVDNRLYLPYQGRYKLSTFENSLKVLKSAFAAALDLKLIAVNPVADMKYSDFCKTRPPVRGCRLDQGGIRKMLREIRKYPVKDRMLIVMLLMHGTRISETCKANMDRINAGRWEIRPEETKAGVMKVIPLTPIAMHVLTEYRRHLRQSIGYRGKHLFFKRSRREPISGTHGSNKIRDISNKHYSAHDIRKRARTWWAENGVDYWIGELILGHSPKGLDTVYIQTLAFDECKRALEMWHKYLVAQGLLDVFS